MYRRGFSSPAIGSPALLCSFRQSSARLTAQHSTAHSLPAGGAMETYASLFCSLCGTLLSFHSETAAAACPLCHSHKDAKAIQNKEFWYRTTSEDLFRRLGIEPLIKPCSLTKAADETGEEAPQLAVVNDECPQCHNPQLEYYTRQLRSADEGQTVFYECPKCHYKFAQNM